MSNIYDPKEEEQKKKEATKELYEAAVGAKEKWGQTIEEQGLKQGGGKLNYEVYLPQSTRKKMEEIFKKLEAREPFSYDIQGDKLYAQYREQYAKAGALAREDAVAQAATLTGGYGNSYGQTLGQQAYNQEMSRLESLVPELYDRAKDAYNEENKALWDQYEALAKEWQTEQEQTLSREKLEYEKEAAAAKAEKEAKDKAYSLALSMLKEGIMPSQEVLSQSGILSADAQALYNANQPAAGGKYSPSNTTNTTTKTTETEQKKELTNTMWEKLRNSYRTGQQKGDLGDFYQLRSMMEAQGYNVKSFDLWARENFGKDYSTGGVKTINWDSVLALGYGPIGEDRLKELLDQGLIEQYTQGDSIYYKKAKTPPSLPTGYGG